MSRNTISVPLVEAEVALAGAIILRSQKLFPDINLNKPILALGEPLATRLGWLLENAMNSSRWALLEMLGSGQAELTAHKVTGESTAFPYNGVVLQAQSLMAIWKKRSTLEMLASENVEERLVEGPCFHEEVANSPVGLLRHRDSRLDLSLVRQRADLEGGDFRVLLAELAPLEGWKLLIRSAKINRPVLIGSKETSSSEIQAAFTRLAKEWRQFFMPDENEELSTDRLRKPGRPSDRAAFEFAYEARFKNGHRKEGVLLKQVAAALDCQFANLSVRTVSRYLSDMRKTSAKTDKPKP